MYKAIEIRLTLDEGVAQRILSQWKVGAVEYKVAEILRLEGYNVSAVVFISPHITIFIIGEVLRLDGIRNAIAQLY